VDNRPGYQDLTRDGLRAQPSRHIDDRAVVAVVDRDRLTEVDPHTDSQREGGMGRRLFDASALDVQSGPDGLVGGIERNQHFVAAQAQDFASASRHRVTT
jgi:hypothetical protein